MAFVCDPSTIGNLLRRIPSGAKRPPKMPTKTHGKVTIENDTASDISVVCYDGKITERREAILAPGEKQEVKAGLTDDGCIWLSVDRQPSSKVPAVEAGGEAFYVYKGGGVFGTPKEAQRPIAPAKEQSWGQNSLSKALPEVRRTRSQGGAAPPQSAIKKKPVKQKEAEKQAARAARDAKKEETRQRKQRELERQRELKRQRELERQEERQEEIDRQLDGCSSWWY